MDLDFILLTSSKKSGNYCIAGIEIQTGNWVRIISEDTAIQHAITPEDMIYEDKSMPKILDRIRIKMQRK